MTDSPILRDARNEGTHDSSGWMSAASYWMPTQYSESAWLQHASFAFWIVDALRPATIVELGTHWGYSYFVFCEAVRRLGIECSLSALDSWEGDDHAGAYGNEVFDAVSAINELEYADISTLRRGYFDDSLTAFADGSIDLLHIDGRHGFEDVSHDFAAWLPKMSTRGVVLFHDVREHKDDFGVWQFWDNIALEFPSFAFDHEHGLGVLGVGSELSPAIQAFFTQANAAEEAVRSDYLRLGSRVSEVAFERLATFELANARTQHSAEVAQHAVAVTELKDEIKGLKQQISELKSSTSWAVTKPVRSIAGFLHRN